MQLDGTGSCGLDGQWNAATAIGTTEDARDSGAVRAVMGAARRRPYVGSQLRLGPTDALADDRHVGADGRESARPGTVR